MSKPAEETPPDTTWDKIREAALITFWGCIAIPVLCVWSCAYCCEVEIKKRRQGGKGRPNYRAQAMGTRARHDYNPNIRKEIPTPPRPRKRRLTLPITPNTKKKQKVADQSGSMLFSMLPIDVRVLIYGFFLTGNIFHIEESKSDRKVRATVCMQPNNPISRTHGCWKKTSRLHESSLKLLSLVLSCRQV